MKTNAATLRPAAGGRCVTAKVFRLWILLMLVLGCPATTASAAVREWTGGVSGYWSDANNWNPVGVPQSGEQLNIKQVAHKVMTNDLDNLSVTLFFEDHDFILYGNTITLRPAFGSSLSLSSGAESSVNVYCGLTLGGDAKVLVGFDSSDFFSANMQLHLRGPINLNGHKLTLEAATVAFEVLGNTFAYTGLIEVMGSISGTGTVHARIYDGSSVTFTGAEENTFSGPLILERVETASVPAPTISLNKQSVPMVKDQLVILGAATVTCGQADQIGDNATVSLAAGSRLLLQNHSDTIGSLFMTNVSSDALATLVDTGGAILSVLGNIGATNSSFSIIPTIQGFLDLPATSHTITVNSGASPYGLDLQAAILGAGGFTKNGTGTLLLQNDNNSFSGVVAVNAGIVEPRQPHAFGDVAGTTQLFGGAVLLRNVNIVDETLVAVGQGTGGVFPGSVLTSVGNNSWSGPVVLNTNLVVSGNMTFTGVISGTAGLGSLDGNTIRLTGNNTYTGANYFSISTLQVDGVQPLSPVDLHNLARLKGNGTVGNINVKGSLPAIAPGSSPGILACGNLDASGGNGQLEIELNGTIPGSGYDQLVVNGTVNLTNLSLSGSRNFSPAQGDSFTIIVNDSSDAVSGTFAGLRQDSQARIGGESFHVNYAGGTGNDVVLTRRGRDITWTNNASGDWNVPANWSPNLVPGTNDTVFINKTVTVTLNTNVNCYSLNMGTSGSPTLTGAGDLTLYVFNFDGFNLSGSQTVTVLHQMTWTGGTMTGSGRTVIQPGATLNLANVNVINLTGGRTLENGGTILWTSGNFGMNSGIITNRAGALFDARTTTGLNYSSNPGSRFDNAGTFRKSVAGTTTLFGGLVFNNYGAVEIQAGTLSLLGGGTHTGTFDVPAGTTLSLAGGTHTVGTGSSITGAGNLYVGGGNPHTFAGLVNLTGTNQFDSGTANLTGNYICTNNTLFMSGGTANFTGTGTVTPAVINMDSGILGGSQTVTVLNQMNWTGGTMTGSGRTFIPAGVTLNIASVSATVSLTGGRTLDNGGTVLWTAGNFAASFAIITNRAGALFEARNVLGLNYSSNPGSRFDNAGTFRKSVIAGTTTVGGGMVFNNYNTVEIQTGTLALSGGGTNGGMCNVLAGATLSLSGGVHTDSSGSSITGAGNFTVTGGATPTLTGLVNVTGTNTFNSSSTANLTGNYICTNNTLIIASANTVNFNGNGIVAPAVLNFSGTTLSGSQTVTVLNQMNWTSGTMTGSGRTIILPGATLNIAASASTISLTIGRTLENGGTVLWTAGNFALNNAIITNRAGALFEARNAVGLNYLASPGSRFDNAGTFRKSVNPGTTTVGSGMVFNNYNTMDIQSGILLANGGYTTTSNSLLSCALGGTTVGTGYGRLQVGGNVTNNGALSVSLANGFLPTTNDTFTVLTAGTRTGTFASFHFPSNEVTMQMSNTANSVIVDVSAVLVLPPPLLHIEKITTATARLYWLTNYPGFHLEYNTTLGTTNWAASALAPVVTDTNFVVTNLLFGAQKFYRLSRVPATYVPPPPLLIIQPASPGNVRLLWPAEDDRTFTLQSNTNLTPANWVVVSPTAVLFGWNYAVTNPITGTQKFYRLVYP